MQNILEVWGALHTWLWLMEINVKRKQTVVPEFVLKA
jgi:hypothetical protein